MPSLARSGRISGFQLGLGTSVSTLPATANGLGPTTAHGTITRCPLIRPLPPTCLRFRLVAYWACKCGPDGGTCEAPIGLTNQIVFWMDNIWFEASTNTAPPPPPTMALQKAGPAGVTIALGSAGGQWDRQAISTPAPNGAYIWTAQGGYPVSYSCTITDFPPVGTHVGFEAHMYIVNGDTAGSGNDANGSPDWNCPDLLLFRIENHRHWGHGSNPMEN